MTVSLKDSTHGFYSWALNLCYYDFCFCLTEQERKEEGERSRDFEEGPRTNQETD